MHVVAPKGSAKKFRCWIDFQKCGCAQYALSHTLKFSGVHKTSPLQKRTDERRNAGAQGDVQVADFAKEKINWNRQKLDTFHPKVVSLSFCRANFTSIRVSKFWREYAGELAVEAIDDKVMREFIPWRRDYYSKFEKLPKNAKRHPTDKTLQWDMMLGKAILKWAAEQGLRGKQPPITVTFTPKKKRMRPAYEVPEYKRLWRTTYRRINSALSEVRQASEMLSCVLPQHAD